jgi:hypothetical protein
MLEKWGKYLKRKTKEPQTNNKNKHTTDSYRGINEFKKSQ